MLNGSKGTVVNPAVYKDVIGDGFAEVPFAPQTDSQGNIVPRAPSLKNNNGTSGYFQQFTSYVDENGVIQRDCSLRPTPPGHGAG